MKAEEVARKNKTYLSIILSSRQISRMKHVELVSELMTSIYNGGLIDKKKAVDKIVGGHSVDKRSLEKCANQFTRVLNLVKNTFPEISATRFAKVVDFYSLFMLIYEMDSQGDVLNDKKRNQQAQELLIGLSNGVDQVRQQVRRAEGATPEQNLFRDYLFTIQGDTDSLATRRRRAEILRQVLGGLFEQKDNQRNFTIEQRRLVWHSDDEKKCKKCEMRLSWNNFTIDHIIAHGRGGRTSISNSALMCRSCNSSKGIR
ncbi:MAG: HNH endonuclease [Pyrinomonadaceae bacterium]